MYVAPFCFCWITNLCNSNWIRDWHVSWECTPRRALSSFPRCGNTSKPTNCKIPMSANTSTVTHSWGKFSKWSEWNLRKFRKDWILCFIRLTPSSSITSSLLKDKHPSKRKRLAMTLMLRSMILSKCKWTAFCYRPILNWRFKTWIIRFTKRWIPSMRWKSNGSFIWVSPKILNCSSTNGLCRSQEVNWSLF